MEIKKEYFPKPPEAEPKILDTLTIPATEEEAYKYLTVDILDIMDLLRKEISDEDFTKNPALLSGRFLGILHKMSELLTDTLGQGKSTNQLKLLYADVFQNRKTGCYLYTFTLDFVKNKAQLRTAFLQDMENFTGIFWRTLTAEKQNYKKPEQHIIIGAKIIQNIFGDMSQREINVGTDSAPVYVYIDIWKEIEGEKLELSQPLTAYDKAVYNAIVSIFNAGNDTMTPEQVYQVLTGKHNIHPTIQAIRKVATSIAKLRRTFVSIDCTEQFKKNSRTKELYKDKDTAGFDDYLLACKGAWIGSRGSIRTGYKFNSAPLLYEYANPLKQVISVPTTLTQISNINAGDNSIVTRDELIRRISMIKTKIKNCHKQKKPVKESYKTILLDTLIKNCDIVPSNTDPDKPERLSLTRTERNRYRVNIVEKILDSFVNEKFIKGYTSKKRGTSLVGYIINI